MRNMHSDKGLVDFQSGSRIDGSFPVGSPLPETPRDNHEATLAIPSPGNDPLEDYKLDRKGRTLSSVLHPEEDHFVSEKGVHNGN